MTELITTEDYDRLPDDPGLKFSAIEAICRSNMRRLINNDERTDYHNVREEYMMIVSTAASELGVGSLPYPSHLNEPWKGVDAFILEASELTTRVRLRSSTSSHAFSVKLAERTRGRIEKQIQVLRDVIAAEEMADPRRKTLFAKLDELSMELSAPRVSFAKVANVLIAVAAACTIGADGPKALHNIMQLIGVDKMAEEAEVRRLGLPPHKPAIAAPKHRQHLLAKPSEHLPAPTSVNHEVVDDDIPF